MIFFLFRPVAYVLDACHFHSAAHSVRDCKARHTTSNNDRKSQYHRIVDARIEQVKADMCIQRRSRLQNEYAAIESCVQSQKLSPEELERLNKLAEEIVALMKNYRKHRCQAIRLLRSKWLPAHQFQENYFLREKTRKIDEAGGEAGSYVGVVDILLQGRRWLL